MGTYYELLMLICLDEVRRTSLIKGADMQKLQAEALYNQFEPYLKQCGWHNQNRPNEFNLENNYSFGWPDIESCSPVKYRYWLYCEGGGILKGKIYGFDSKKAAFREYKRHLINERYLIDMEERKILIRRA